MKDAFCTPKVETAGTSENLINIYQDIRRHIPLDQVHALVKLE